MAATDQMPFYPRQYTLAQLADIVGGRCLGAGDTPISGVGPFDQAAPGDLTLAEGSKFLKQIPNAQAAAVIVSAQAEGDAGCSKPLLIADNPRLAFAQVLQLFHGRDFVPSGVSPLASLGKACRIAETVSIHPFVSLGDDVEIEERVTLYPGVVIGRGCRIGADSVLYPNVTVYSGVSLGKRVTIHSGAVLGADGFGYVFDGERQFKIPQTGGVEIHDEVEIGANSCIDCATFGKTIIERGVKIDNLVQIGHNCRIGENTVICGCVGISGSVTVGKNCVLAGNVGVKDHVVIGDHAMVLAKSGVDKDVAPNSVVFGIPAREHREYLKLIVLFGQLPRLYKELKELQAWVKARDS
ncbi:MAG: UDP-3-O-(3-hydroxymyristoyl)glucosamine N-acyltransferase [Gammaproteobacteria bacterium]